MPLSADDLLARLRALDDFLRDDPRFVRSHALTLGAPAEAAALEAVEASAGVSLPEPWRSFLITHGASGGIAFHLEEDHAEALEADTGGGDGGFELLGPELLAKHHARLRARDAGAPAFLPFAKDPSAATYVGVVATPRGPRITRIDHDAPIADAERWPVDDFFDGWSRAGFAIDFRWEDQPEPVVALFVEAMGLADEDE